MKKLYWLTCKGTYKGSCCVALVVLLVWHPPVCCDCVQVELIWARARGRWEMIQLQMDMMDETGPSDGDGGGDDEGGE